MYKRKQKTQIRNYKGKPGPEWQGGIKRLNLFTLLLSDDEANYIVINARAANISKAEFVRRTVFPPMMKA